MLGQQPKVCNIGMVCVTVVLWVTFLSRIDATPSVVMG